ncbi:MAG: lipid-A-disaccharide synthase N-terminal domain-containing protein [Pseudomonadota bacterium]
MIDAILAWFHAVFVEQFSGWIVLGFVAQFLFMMRFLVQWIASERVGKSIVPVAFWFFSVGGGTLLLIYAISRQDPVFIAGQSLGLIIYFRNLWLIFKEKKREGAPDKQPG